MHVGCKCNVVIAMCPQQYLESTFLHCHNVVITTLSQPKDNIVTTLSQRDFVCWVKPIFHCDAKSFALGTFVLPNARNTNMLVSFALGDANFSHLPDAFYPTRFTRRVLPDAFYPTRFTRRVLPDAFYPTRFTRRVLSDAFYPTPVSGI